MKDKYYYVNHGLLYIVYSQYDTGMGITSTEDSRWLIEKDAQDHCDILNKNK